MQDKEVGDGTTSVVILAAELLKVCLHACSRIGALFSPTRCVSLVVVTLRYYVVLQRANDLVRIKIHPTSIMAGYRLAMKEAIKYVKSNLLIPGNTLERDFLVNAAKVCMIICNVTEARDSVVFRGLYGFNVCGCSRKKLLVPCRPPCPPKSLAVIRSTLQTWSSMLCCRSRPQTLLANLTTPSRLFQSSSPTARVPRR